MRFAVFTTCCLVLLVPGSLLHAQDAAALFLQASKLQNAGKFADALKVWERFVKEYEKDPALGLAYQGLGTCQLETGAFAQAIDAFGQSLKCLPAGESPSNLRWNLALAWQRRAEQSKDAAYLRQLAEALEFLLTDKGTSRERQALAAFYLARAERAQGKKDAARQRLEDLLANPPDRTIRPATRLALARWAEEARAWPRAAQLYEDFLKFAPEHAAADEARLGLAEAYFQQSSWQQAETWFAQLKDSKTSSGADYAQFRWTELAGLRGDLTEAGRRWRQFLEHAPKSAYRARALASAGEAFHQLQDYAAAADAWERLLRDFPPEPGRPDLQIRLGWALVHDAQWQRAENHLKAALEQKLPANQRGKALWGWARCAGGLKKADEAFRRYEELCKAEDPGPSGDQVLYEAVLAAFAVHEIKTGLRWNDRLVGRFPKSSWTANAQLQSARRLADQADYDAAGQRCRWVLDSAAAELQAPALYLAGFCALKTRKFQEAIPYFEKLRDKHPRSDQAAVAGYSLGVVLESLGAPARALAAYQDFLKQHPGHALAPQAAKRVQILLAK